jgi:hypothetical protein
MIDESINMKQFSPESASRALEIISRMGWCGEDVEGNGVYVVNIPIDDADLFYFIFEEFI